MKKHCLLAASFTLALASFAHAGYRYKYKVTVDHTQAGSSDSANFPILVSLSSSDFKTSANGGSIQNTVTLNGQTVPADLIVTTDSGCATKVTAWEVASYSATGGTVELWVNQGTLSHTADTVFYICIDNSAVTTYQSTATSAWETHFKLVLHAANGASLSGNDSTSNGNNASSVTGTASTGQIDGGASLSGSQQLLIPNSSSLQVNTGDFTISCWFKQTTTGSYAALFDRGVTYRDYSIFINGGTFAYYGVGGNANVLSSPSVSTGTWYYFVWTRSGSSNRISVNNGTATTFTDSGSTDHGDGLSIGKNPSGGGSGFIGIEDEFRVANTARSADWITAEYNMEKSSQTMVSVGARQSNSMTGHGGQIMDASARRPAVRGLHAAR